MNRTVAIIPVRVFPEAKHRLAKNRDSNSRKELVQAMLADVLTALQSTKTLRDRIIITCDEIPITNFSQVNVVTYRSAVKGLNSELMTYANLLEKSGVQEILIILADLPLLSSEVVDEIVTTGQNTQRPVIAQDWKGAGTNILFSHLPLPIKLSFGNESLSKHQASFEKVGLSPIIYHSLESALDIDDDLAIERFLVLAQFDQKRQQTHTYRVLNLE